MDDTLHLTESLAVSAGIRLVNIPESYIIAWRKLGRVVVFNSGKRYDIQESGRRQEQSGKT